MQQYIYDARNSCDCRFSGLLSIMVKKLEPEHCGRDSRKVPRKAAIAISTCEAKKYLCRRGVLRIARRQAE